MFVGWFGPAVFGLKLAMRDSNFKYIVEVMGHLDVVALYHVLVLLSRCYVRCCVLELGASCVLPVVCCMWKRVLLLFVLVPNTESVVVTDWFQVYWPYLLMNKKRYAGLLWTKVDKYDKMDTKGLETVRRDNCLLVRKVMSSTTIETKAGLTHVLSFACERMPLSPYDPLFLPQSAAVCHVIRWSTRACEKC